MNIARTKGLLSRTALAALLFASGQAALGQAFSSGSTGADGALTLTTSGSTNITLKPGGVYHYTTVTIGSSHTVNYLRNPDNAPVVILATGDVTIDGTINVNGFAAPNWGSGGSVRIGAAGGAGGFNGGNGGHFGASFPTAGHGPGGGTPSNGIVGGSGGSYGAPTAFVGLTPLFGGSGGGGSTGSSSFPFGGAGAGGGGAILIASSTRILINGTIRANGGDGDTAGVLAGGAGSGGAIRLVAPEIVGVGALQALRGSDGSGVALASDGRIRLESFDLTGFTGTAAPVASVANAPGAVSPAGNPALANVPTLAITSVGGVPTPAITVASYFSPDMALAPGTTNPVPVVLSVTNTPVGIPTEITLRVMPAGSPVAIVVPASNHTGSFASSTATADVTLPVGQVAVLQAHAAMTLTGQSASLFPLIDGEPVQRVMVAATQGKPSSLSLVTRSGKQVPVEKLDPEDRVRVALAWEVMRATNGR